MLSKFSVKKPMTIMVAVITVIVLGIISFTKMQTDLLPSINLPYVAVITTYPGASPEKVEQGVTKPLEAGLATTSGVEEVTSISSENMSMVVLMFTESTNMDSAMIEMSGKVDQIKGRLDDAVGTPQMMKINPDLMPVMVAAVDVDGLSQEEVSQLVSEEVIPSFERLDGVAQVSSMGLVEKQLKVTLNQEKIDAINDTILRSVDSKLADTKKELDEGEAKLKDAKSQLESQNKTQTQKLLDAEEQLNEGRSQLNSGREQLNSALAQATDKRADLETQKQLADVAIQKLQEQGLEVPQELLDTQAQLAAGLEAADAGIVQIQQQLEELKSKESELNKGQTQLEQGKLALSQGIATAQAQLLVQEGKLAEGRAQFDQASEGAYEQANLSGQLTKDTIGQILSAQNFSMPAGNIVEDETAYAVKVGDLFENEEDLSSLVLFNLGLDELDTVTLADVADISFTDNSGETYAKINGNDGILLTFSKQSTASTVEVSDKLRGQMEKLEQEYEGMHLTALSDQGVYINIVVNSVMENLLWGGLLAILILLIFLRNVRPTIVIALSIPISLLFAIALMYFTGVTLNIISLAGLALGVGMLVDNSIVVIENIYRMRAQGLSAAKAAVRGAGQVAAAVTASTLTTVCVFLPIVFTEGLSRELFTDMGLTIAYSLVASLIVSLTLVPALSSWLLKKPEKKGHRLFDKFTAAYGKLLALALRRKSVVLILALVLLGVSIYGSVQMGTAFMPESDSNQIAVTMEMPKDSTTQETRDMADKVAGIVAELPGVDTVGAMEGGGLMSGSSSGGAISMYVILEEQRDQNSKAIAQNIIDATSELPCEITASGTGMDSMTEMMGGSGIQIDISGDDMDQLKAIAKDVAAMLSEVEGTQEISNGMEDAEMETRVSVDKNKAMEYGLTTAQVYQQLAAELVTETTATTVTLGGEDYPLIVADDPGAALTRETLGELTLSGTKDGEAVDVPLQDIAQITQAQGLTSINHENQTRLLSVTAAVDAQHNIGLVSRQVESKLADYEVPEGYEIVIAGETEMINDTLEQLVLMVVLAVVLIYLIMVAQFQSLLSPFIVMFTMPLAFTGGLLALWMCGMEISMISMLGFLVLAGIVVNNGIVFIDYVNQLRASGMERRDALVRAGQTRLRPILMTALTTILGLTTMAMGIGMGAEMIQPMAVVTIGGLSYATLLTLFVVPALYDIMQRRPVKNVQLEGEQVDQAL
ncbi:Swarming motility protein SwrC [uncultured Clostridium sp.]|nr:Swarming motility protein SwrC [uncultured Clostridium sp.]